MKSSSVFAGSCKGFGSVNAAISDKVFDVPYTVTKRKTRKEKFIVFCTAQDIESGRTGAGEVG